MGLIEEWIKGRVIPIKCAYKNYDWGKLGSDSFVGSILKFQGRDIDESIPYAELWMGTHKSGTALISEMGPNFDNRPLSDLFKIWPEFFGTVELATKYGYDLPFLFKLLSIAKPLSIQVHPDKKFAEQLNANSPSLYTDPNHKPEMVIAYTTLHILCYFRPHEQIISYIQEIPQLANIIGSSAQNYVTANPSKRKDYLKQCFTALMQAPQEVINENLTSLLASNNCDPIVCKIAEHFPNDCGCFAFYFLNYLQVKPGEAVFIDVNEPHCYLYGNCIECMACSDNVIRAGLTTKFKDVDLLLQVLTYIPKEPSQFIINCKPIDNVTSLYICPAQEFMIETIRLLGNKVNQSKYYSSPKDSCSIVIVISGSARVNNGYLLKKGDTYFIPARVGLNFTFAKEELVLYRALIKS